MSVSNLPDQSGSYLSSRSQRIGSPSAMSTEATGKQPNVIGFYHIPDHIQRKVIRKGFDFTLLVAGESGLGKSTFINTLFIQDLYKDRTVPLAADLIKRTVQIEKHSVEIEEFGIKLRLTVVDTPGFGDTLNTTESWKPIRDYIEQQYESYYQAESSVNRRNIQDARVHCCVYFISPNGYGLHRIDIEFMKSMQDLVSIIPVIAKADTLTTSELERLKEKIKRDIATHQINVYDFSGIPLDPDESDDSAKRWNRELQEMMPFAVIGGNTAVEVNGRKVRARAYPWGVIEIDNNHHCDFAALREMLVSTHMQDLKDRMIEVHYEDYRARRILSPLQRPIPMTKKSSSSDVVVATKAPATANPAAIPIKVVPKATSATPPAATPAQATPAQPARAKNSDETATKQQVQAQQTVQQTQQKALQVQQQSQQQQQQQHQPQSKSTIYKVP